MAKLYFYYAAMNAGKSTTLLQADFNYRERGMETMLWTADLDDRAGAGMIGSRIGLEAGAQRAEDRGLAGTLAAFDRDEVRMHRRQRSACRHCVPPVAARAR